MILADDYDLEAFRHQLLNLQQQLLSDEKDGRDAAGIVELDQSKVGRLSRMDALQGQAMSQAINRRRETELKKITAALQRLDNGCYGYCMQCEEAIAHKRLQFDPSASLCIDCASKLE